MFNYLIMELFITDTIDNRNHSKIIFKNPCEKGRSKGIITNFCESSKYWFVWRHLKKNYIYKNQRTENYHTRIWISTAVPEHGILPLVCYHLCMDSLHAMNCSEQKGWWEREVGSSNKVCYHGECGWLASLGDVWASPSTYRASLKGLN